MANLENALQQLRAERREAQLHVEKLDQAISVIESLNGLGSSRNPNQPKRIISAASRRKMALAQKARWANVRKGPQSAAGATKLASATLRSAPCRHQLGKRLRLLKKRDGQS